MLRRGFWLEYVTLSWNVAGIGVLGFAAVAARSVALAGFGLDSLIEIGASTVVIWELSSKSRDRQRRGMRLIGYAFTALALYLLVQSTLVLAVGYHPGRSVAGIAWTGATAAAMFALAAGKARTGRALDSPVLRTEGRVTMIDGILATAVLAGLVLNATVGWWWADPAAGYVLVYYAAREVREIFCVGSLPAGVARHVLRDDADDHADDLGRQRQVILARARSRVLLGQARGERAADVLGHRGPAADLGVHLGVPLVVDGKADPGVTPDVHVFTTSLR
jgi:hypothetical protein